MFAYPLVIGILILGRTVLALLSGSASADNKGLLREDEPFVYWLTITGGFIASAVLFGIAY